MDSIERIVADRRQATRIDCCYQVECRRASTEFSASVVNMGLGGMRFVSAQPLEPEDLITVRQPDGALAPLTVRVVWTRPHGAKLNFESGVVYLGPVQQLESSWVKSALQRLGFEGAAIYERRRHLRTLTDIAAHIELDGHKHACRLLDLGLGGALIQTGKPVPLACEGAEIKLFVEIPGCQPLLAQIVYLRNPQDEEPGESARRYGLCFEKDGVNKAHARLVEGYLQAMGSAR